MANKICHSIYCDYERKINEIIYSDKEYYKESYKRSDNVILIVGTFITALVFIGTGLYF
ncbi:hypothetical protein Ga0466249_002476 [Sporomusaceae bacterium BoRhaA]|nr:hypothetical protein [Pelorhabdus rhamnosifermentans]